MPCDIAPLEKRRTIVSAGSTSSSVHRIHGGGELQQVAEL